MGLTADDARLLNRLLDDVELGRLDAARERRLRGLLARVDPEFLSMPLSDVYRFGTMTAGYMRLLDVAEGRAVIVDV